MRMSAEIEAKMAASFDDWKLKMAHFAKTIKT